MNQIKRNLWPAEWTKSWRWLFLILFLSPLLPEYIAPFTVTFGYLFFLFEQKKQGAKIKLGFQGKAEMLYMCYMLLAACWSATFWFSAAMAGLFMWMFLAGLMIANLCTSEKLLHRGLRCFVWSAGALGLLGGLQFLSRVISPLLHVRSIIPDPFYKVFDAFVLKNVPFLVKDKFFVDRSSGTFTNPNIFATILVIALPFALYFLLKAVNRRERWLYLGITLALAAGVATSKSRIALAAMVAALVICMFCFGKKKAKIMFGLLIVLCAAAIPMIFTRFTHTLAQVDEFTFSVFLETLLGGESSDTHVAIWQGCADYLFHNPKAFLIGLGGGTDNSWAVIRDLYGINQPHAHNLLLEVWMEYGIIGLSLFLTPMVIFVRNMLRVIRDKKRTSKNLRTLARMAICALVCYNIAGLTDYLFNSPKQIMLLFLLYGFGQAIYRIYAQNKKGAPVRDAHKELITKNS